jgi:hypothetical protein
MQEALIIQSKASRKLIKLTANVLVIRYIKN